MTNEERDTLLQGMASDIGEIKTDVAVIKEKVNRHEKTLYGNGSPGLCTRLQKVEDTHENENKSASALIAWLGIGTSIIAVVAAVVALIK